SLVTVGEPKLFSMTTLRPFGPRVTFTASARALTPWRMRLRADSWKTISLAAMISVLLTADSLFDDAEDVVLAQYEVFLTLELHFRAGVLPQQHTITDLDAQLDALAVFHLARANGDDFALDGLFLRRVRDDDHTFGLVFFF